MLTLVRKKYGKTVSDRAVSSGVEHYIHTVGVAGSKPAPPTRIKQNATPEVAFSFLCFFAAACRATRISHQAA